MFRSQISNYQLDRKEEGSNDQFIREREMFLKNIKEKMGEFRDKEGEDRKEVIRTP